jgi:hypothetical protein
MVAAILVELESPPGAAPLVSAAPAPFTLAQRSQDRDEIDHKKAESLGSEWLAY